MDLGGAGLRLFDWNSVMEDSRALPAGSRIALLAPPLGEPGNTQLRDCIAATSPQRVVYISSTGVYGMSAEVNANTVAQPAGERGVRRMAEEAWVLAGPWSSLVLRAAAIYGPGRGVHTAVREGRIPRGGDAGVVSRIHVNDLAALVDAGLFSEIGGAWPAADEDPCCTAEIVRWCLGAAGPTRPEDFAPAGVPSASMSGRRVDGRQIFEMLGVELQYSSWKTGIPASLAEEVSG